MLFRQANLMKRVKGRSTVFAYTNAATVLLKFIDEISFENFIVAPFELRYIVFMMFKTVEAAKGSKFSYWKFDQVY